VNDYVDLLTKAGYAQQSDLISFSNALAHVMEVWLLMYLMLLGPFN
jgi:hypothetical protein